MGANVFLGREPLRGGFIDESTIRTESAKFLEMVGLDVAPDVLVGDLTIGRQQMVVTLKMLARRVRTRSQVRAPLTMSQQRIVADYEEQVYQVRV